MPAFTHPTPTIRQVSGLDPAGRYILSVLLKRTFVIAPDGRLVEADEQVPLTVGAVPDPDNPKLLAADTDLYPFKLASDVIVQGHAYGRSAVRFDVSVRVGPFGKLVRVTGDRRCALTAAGHLLFSDPAPCERVALRHDHAYGGLDAAAEERYGNAIDTWRPYLTAEWAGVRPSPFDYPRNPAGRGYLVEATARGAELLQLPNLEDPSDLVAPDRLVVGHVRYWPRMPLPYSLDWMDLGWFPRVAYFGIVPDHEPGPTPVAEVHRGFAPADVLDAAPRADKFSFRCANGASLGLQLPYLRGDEEVELFNLHPTRPHLVFRLPGERPRIWVDGRKGAYVETEPVLHTLVVQPDEDRVTLVWRGAAPALRPYLAEELDVMPLWVSY